MPSLEDCWNSSLVLTSKKQRVFRYKSFSLCVLSSAEATTADLAEDVAVAVEARREASEASAADADEEDVDLDDADSEEEAATAVLGAGLFRFRLGMICREGNMEADAVALLVITLLLSVANRPRFTGDPAMRRSV